MRVVCSILFLSAALALPALDAGALQAPVGSVAIEAESAVSYQLPFRLAADERCAGGAGLTIPEGAGKPPEVGGRATYVVTVDTTGAYRLWMRALWNNGEGNSFVVQVGRNRPALVGQDGTYHRWHWVRGPEAVLKPGSHRLSVYNREDGVSLDRILLIPDADFVPRGKEGLRVPSGWMERDLFFGDDFARNDDTDTGIWQPVSGKWQINFSLDPSAIPNYHSYIGESEASALSIAGYGFWRDYRLSAALKTFGCQSAGLAFSVLDPKHYHLVRWAKGRGKEGRLELVRVVAGKEKHLASASAPRCDEKWHSLSVAAHEDDIEVCVDGFPVLRHRDAAIPGGKVGLYVSGGKTAFDNVEVRAIRVFRSDPVQDAERWEKPEGQWQAAGDGASSGAGKPLAIAVTGKSDWKDYQVRTEVAASQESVVGLVVCWQSAKDFYLFEVDAGARLIRVRDGTATILDGQDRVATGAGPRRISFRRVGAHLAGYVNGRRAVEAWDDGLKSGRPGLRVVSRSPVTFRGFEVEFLRPTDFVRTIDDVAFLRPKVVDPSDVPDFTDEQLKYTLESPESDRLRRRPRYFPVIGKGPAQSLWTQTAGAWVIAEERLTATLVPGLERASVYYNRPMPRDAAIRAHISWPPQDAGRVGVLLNGSRADMNVGYRLSIGPDGDLLLEGNGERLAQRRVEPFDAEDLSIALWRSGNWLLGWLNGQLVITCREAAPPAAEEVALWADGMAQIKAVKLEALDYLQMQRFYPFDRPEPDWLSVQGRFDEHAGTSCQTASSWISMIGKQGEALMWNKRAFDGDISVTLKALEYTIWHGWSKSPTHEHSAYKNIGIALCADGRDIASGYTVIVNGWTLRRSAIGRKGRVVAQVAQGEEFPCRYVGGHGPITPRTSNISVLCRDGLLRLFVNSQPVLEYRDPDPLRGGRIGIWCWDATMNLTDVHLRADSSRPQAPDQALRSLDARSDIGRFIRSIEPKMGL